MSSWYKGVSAVWLGTSPCLSGELSQLSQLSQSCQETDIMFGCGTQAHAGSQRGGLLHTIFHPLTSGPGLHSCLLDRLLMKKCSTR